MTGLEKIIEDKINEKIKVSEKYTMEKINEKLEAFRRRKNIVLCRMPKVKNEDPKKKV